MGASHLTGKTSPLTRHQGSGCGTLSLEWAHLGPEDLSEVNRGGGRGILGGRGRGGHPPGLSVPARADEEDRTGP